jgi:hypothetical protein
VDVGRWMSEGKNKRPVFGLELGFCLFIQKLSTFFVCFSVNVQFFPFGSGYSVGHTKLTSKLREFVYIH